MNLTGQQVVDELEKYKSLMEARLKEGPRVFNQNPKVLAQSITTLESALYRIKIANEEAGNE